MKESSEKFSNQSGSCPVQRIVRQLWSSAPAIGSKDSIYCGVRKGRHCTVGSDGDPFRLCTIIGYQIEMGEACGVSPRNFETVILLVKVRMNTPHPLIERERLSHVGCLKSYQANVSSTHNQQG